MRGSTNSRRHSTFVENLDGGGGGKNFIYVFVVHKLTNLNSNRQEFRFLIDFPPKFFVEAL